MLEATPEAPTTPTRRPPARSGAPGVPGALSSPHRAAGLQISAVVLGVVAAGGALYGILLRVWLLVHLPVWGDEAIVGLMARSIDGGHFSAFYWGQHYGGLEPYLVALGLKVGGGGEPAMNATPTVLAACAAVIVVGIVVAAGRDKVTAFAAGSAVWAWPFVVVWQSVREGGFREATLFCGLVAILCSIRVSRNRAGGWTLLLLGVALGLGWWASPEIVYFAPPCLVLLWGWMRSGHARTPDHGAQRAPRRWAALTIVALGAVIGSVPWWYANAHTGFASLQQSALPNNGGITYWTKVSVFFHDMLPLQLGLRTAVGGNWVGGTSVGVTLYVMALILIVAALARAVAVYARDTRQSVPLAVGVGVLCYPFLYAAAPGTGYWIDGRYGIYFPALVVVLLTTMPLQPFLERRSSLRGAHAAPALNGESTLLRRSHIAMTVALAGALCLTVVGAHDFGVPASASFFSGWHSGDAPMQQVVDAMRAHHIKDAYGDYWTAYDLDFVSDGHPTVSPSPYDVSRSASIAASVRHSRDPAWLFFAPTQAAEATTEFGNPQPGPGPFTEATFEAHLTQLGIPYSVVPLGVLDAIVPSRTVPTS